MFNNYRYKYLWAYARRIFTSRHGFYNSGGIYRSIPSARNGFRYKIFVFTMFFTLTALPMNFTQAAGNLSDWNVKLDSGALQTDIYQVDSDIETDERIVTLIAGIFAFAPFLGVHYIIRIVIGGYEWMTASGNSEKIETAKKRMKNATIGIFLFAIIYFASYFFVTNFARIAGYNI